MSRIVILRASHVAPDPRVERAASVASAKGWDVDVLAWDRSGDLDATAVTSYGAITRFKRAAEHGRGLPNLVGLVLFQLFLATGTLRRRKDLVAIHACDLSTGLTGLVLSRLLSVPLIYDVFDYYVDSFPVPGRAKWLVRRLETHVIEAAHEVILPSAGRQAQIAPAQPRRLTIVENSPDPTVVPQAQLASCDLAYVGILAQGRLLEEVASQVAVEGRITLRIAGFGPLSDQIERIAEDASNIEFLGKVDGSEAMQIMSSASIMFATYDPAIPNHRYSAPNKLAEALSLGKPLVVCRGTAIDRQVESSGLGRVIEYDADEFLRVVTDVLADDEFLARCASAGPDLYRTSHSWPVNAARLDQLYARATPSGHHEPS